MHLRKGFTFSTSYLNWDFEVAVTSLSAQSDEGEPDRTRWFKFSSASSTLEVRIDGDDDDDDYNDIFSSDKPVTFDDLGGYDQEKQTFIRLLRQSLNGRMLIDVNFRLEMIIVVQFMITYFRKKSL